MIADVFDILTGHIKHKSSPISTLHEFKSLETFSPLEHSAEVPVETYPMKQTQYPYYGGKKDG